MADLIVIDNRQLLGLERYVKRISTSIPSTVLPRATNEWGLVLERDMKNSAFQSKIRSGTGDIYGAGIEWRQRPKGLVGRLFVRQSYVYLDSMSRHWVNVTASRTGLLNWALGAARSSISLQAKMVRRGIIKQFAVQVKPHPFLDRGFNRAIRKLSPIIDKHVDRELRKE